MILSRESIQRMITDMVGGGGGAGISSSALANLLTGYATQDWVGENYISIEFFSRLFQAHGTESGQQTDIAPNDMDSTITSIESLFGFWTDLYISALGNGGSIGSSIYLSTLADVQLSSPSTGQVLTYNATTGQWVNANGGVSSLADLTDVTLTSVADSQILIYDGTNSKWINTGLKTVNGYSLIGSGNISISGSGSGTRWLDAYVSGRPTTINWVYGDDRLRYFIADSGVSAGCPPMGNAMGLHFSWDNTAGGGVEAQLAIGHQDHRRMQFRCQQNGVWKDWGTVQDSLHTIQVTIENDKQTLMDLCNYSPNPYGLIVTSTNSGALMMQSKRRGSSTEFFALCLNHEGGKVGVGTNSPSFKLDCTGTGRFGGSEGILIAGANNDEQYRGCIDRIGNTNPLHLQFKNVYGIDMCVSGGNVAIGTMLSIGQVKLRVLGAGHFGTPVNDGIYIAADNTGDQSSYGTIDRVASNSNLYLQATNSGHVILCNGGGNVGIGITNASYKLHVVGTIYATGAVTALSDARKKDVQKGVAIGVEQIADAPAVQFLWKDERAKEGLQVGTLAQYWQTVLPEVVMDKGGELSMQYGVAALVSAIITARKVVDHERRIQELEKENQDLRREISNIRVKTNIHMRGGIG